MAIGTEYQNGILYAKGGS